MECIRHFLLPLLPLLTLFGQVLLTLGTLYDDYEQCKAYGHFGASDGSLVCDPEGRLMPQALTQLNGMLTEMERDVGCRCADGCDGKKYSVRLLVTSGERVEESGGTTALNETAERIWDSEGMGTEHCDNGMLMLYIRDQKTMVTYQGHRRLQIYSDQDIDHLHELTLRANQSGAAAPLTSDGEAQQRAEDEENPAPIIGLSVALALTFFILFCLLFVLAVKCCSVCCCRQKRKRKKTAKYYLDTAFMPNYKSVEPIYIVTPNVNSSGDAAVFAPPSGASLYGTATFPRRAGPAFSPHPPPRPGMLFGHPPPPPPHGIPFVHRSRSPTPPSTQRTRRNGGVQSMHSTPEPNKRDKIDHTMTVRSNATYYTASNAANPSPEHILATKKPFSHPQHPSTSTNRELSDTPSPQISNSFPFLDPKRKQEIQTREEFIG